MAPFRCSRGAQGVVPEIRTRSRRSGEVEVMGPRLTTFRLPARRRPRRVSPGGTRTRTPRARCRSVRYRCMTIMRRTTPGTTPDRYAAFQCLGHYLRMLTARATTRTATTSEIASSAIIRSLPMVLSRRRRRGRCRLRTDHPAHPGREHDHARQEPDQDGKRVHLRVVGRCARCIERSMLRPTGSQ